MKSYFIFFPDATNEQIDSMMKLYGDGVNAAKGDITTLNQQLKAAQDALTAAKGAPDSADELAKAQAQLSTFSPVIHLLFCSNPTIDVRPIKTIIIHPPSGWFFICGQSPLFLATRTTRNTFCQLRGDCYLLPLKGLTPGITYCSAI